MSTSSTSTLFTPLQFTGISQYSADYQSILTRAEGIAQLPVTAMQNRQATIQQQELDLTTLGAAATAVGSALKALGQLAAGQGLSATSSNSKVVTATNNGAAAGTSFAITNVTSIASAAAATTTTAYSATGPVANLITQTMQLVVGSQTYTINLDGTNPATPGGTPEPNTLKGLEDAINNSGAGVTASILTTGSGNYLSLTAASLGTTALQINDTQNVLTTGGSPGSSTTAASATLTATYPDTGTTAVSATGNMMLTFGGASYSISLAPAQNNLTGLKAAINGLLTAGGLPIGVAASISPTQPYQLSITASNNGANALQLIDNPQNALTTVSSGSSTTAASAITTTYPDTDATHVSASGNMVLAFGGASYSISLAPAQNNLTGLANAINGLSAAGVTASITANQLTITAKNNGANTLQLLENNTKNIVTQNNPGTNTVFTLDGISPPISEATTTINDVIPGVTLNFAGLTATAPAETVTVSLANNTSNIQSALQTLVSSYNTLATAELGQFGTGSLTGNSIIYQIRQAMSSLLQNQGTGSMNNLSSLGIQMSTTGQMSLDLPTFSALNVTQIAASLQLLGTSTTGIGGLQQAFSSITDPVSGAVQRQESQWATTVTNLTDQINAKNTQNLAREQTLNRLLQAADSTSAQLASQQNILTASIASLNFTSYGFNPSPA